MRISLPDRRRTAGQTPGSIEAMSATDQIAGEYSALTEAAGFLRRPEPAILALTGDDAAEFLQGQLTNDIEAIESGEGRYAALLSPKGKLRADMRVLRTAETILLITDTARLPVIRHTIDTFRIGYFFSAEDRSEEWGLLSVIGPDAHELLGLIADNDLELDDAENSNADLMVEGSAAIAISTLLGVDLLAEPDVIDAAAALLEDRGATPVSAQAAEIVRVENRIPVFDHELDENTIPGEAGLNERAVNFEKGCYVGQETVARMHYKGKPNRQLRGLSAQTPLTAGATIVAADGRELGRLGSAVVSPDFGAIGLAVLRREAEAGDKVVIDGVEATVVDIESFPN
jgi:folate-binding protein YgfZ